MAAFKHGYVFSTEMVEGREAPWRGAEMGGEVYRARPRTLTRTGAERVDAEREAERKSRRTAEETSRRSRRGRPAPFLWDNGRQASF